MYANARWGDQEQTFILAERDGSTVHVPADPGNADFRRLTAGAPAFDLDATPIAEFASPAPSADDVRAEAARRILSRYPLWKQQNLMSRRVQLLIKPDGDRTPEDRAEARAIDAALEWIDRMRSASDVMEASPPIDFEAAARWPSPP